MEYKDPVFDLLSNPEQIVFKDQPQTATHARTPSVFLMNSNGCVRAQALRQMISPMLWASASRWLKSGNRDG